MVDTMGGTPTLAFLQTPWAIPWWARALEFLPLAIGAAAWLGRHRLLVTLKKRRPGLT